MYWIHQIENRDHFDALWDLLDQKNLLTIGWQELPSNSELDSAVFHRDEKRISREIQSKKLPNKIETALVNFANMRFGDVVIVFPVIEFEPRFFVVKIKSQNARGILNLPENLQSGFVSARRSSRGHRDGFRKIDFVSSFGFYFASDTAIYPETLDARFFHEVEIVARLPRDSKTPQMDKIYNFNSNSKDPMCRKIQSTSDQKAIFDSLPKNVQSKIL